MIDDQRALAISRSETPSLADMEAMLEWARAAPSGDKILPLLALETGGLATKKKLGEALVDALATCGKDAKAPLWTTIEKDFDDHRIAIAIRALGKVGGAGTLQKLLSLAEAPLVGAVWSAIEEVAEASGVTVQKSAIASHAARGKALSRSERQTFHTQRRAAWGKPTVVVAAKARPAAAAMVAAKPSKVVATKLPASFSAKGEKNKMVAAMKAVVARTYSPTSMESLFSVVRLSWWLEALDRNQEALAVSSFPAETIAPTDDHDVWTPVAQAITHAARLHRRAGEPKRARKLLDVLVAHPAEDPLTKARVKTLIETATKEIDDASTRTPKVGSIALATALARLAYMREMSSPGLPYAGVVPLERVETLTNRALTMLRAQLAG